MSYTDYSSHWVLDAFLTYLEANVLGSNDQHLYDSLAVEHNINTATIDGTHKANSITGSSINTTPASTGSQAILGGATWTPTVGVYQVVNSVQDPNSIILQLFVSAAWRSNINADSTISGFAGIVFCDGSNMRFINNETLDANTVYYQKF